MNPQLIVTKLLLPQLGPKPSSMLHLSHYNPETDCQIMKRYTDLTTELRTSYHLSVPAEQNRRASPLAIDIPETVTDNTLPPVNHG